MAKHLCVCARVCERASERERARAREGNERARGSEREESERASSTRRAAALRSRDVLWNSFILCACGPATPPHNLRGCPHGWAAGLLPDRSTSFRALAQPARRWWPQRSGVTQIHSGITQRANSAVQSIRGNAKCQNVTQCNAKPSQHQRGAFAKKAKNFGSFLWKGVEERRRVGASGHDNGQAHAEGGVDSAVPATGCGPRAGHRQ